MGGGGGGKLVGLFLLSGELEELYNSCITYILLSGEQRQF